MMPRFHTILMAGVMAAGTMFSPFARAQEPAPAGAAAGGSVQDELRALRAVIEQQSKQIDSLAAQVARLQAHLDTRAAVASAPGAAVAAPGAAAVGAVAGAAVSEGEVVAPAARVVPPNTNVHIVVKGDSLEKIAKQHGTTVADLLKLNKISDPKKMQIGQQINLPPAAATAPAPEKKEGQ